jgi:hypothetical protein
VNKTTRNHLSHDINDPKSSHDPEFSLEEVEMMFGRGKRVL